MNNMITSDYTVGVHVRWAMYTVGSELWLDMSGAKLGRNRPLPAADAELLLVLRSEGPIFVL